MKFLEAKRLVEGFGGGEALAFMFGLSGTAEPFNLYLRAAAAKRGRSAAVRFLPFNTLGQHLHSDAEPGRREVYLVLPWDFVPETDWRSGVPERTDEDGLRARAEETAALLARRPNARLLYLPAPVPPLFADASRSEALARWLESLANGLGARVIPPQAFELAGYLASGCPAGGAWIGSVAEAAVEAALSPPPQPKKVLVTDLDNTMWSGVLAEEGLQGIAYEPSGRGYRHFVYQTLLRRLRGEGTLLAAVTRNDPEIAVAPFRAGRMTLREDDFVSIVASYHAKSAQIRGLAEHLNLGLDAFVFVDDNPVERAEVSEALPMVRCLAFPADEGQLPSLFTELAQLFSRATITAEDRERTTLYRRRMEGMLPSALEGADVTPFLQGLAMTLTLHDRSKGDRARAVQLINKTNQFNLNGLRVTDDDVVAVLGAGGHLLGASLSDRTGDHGEILACLIAPDRTVTALVMSCRVFQRRVEHAFLAWLLQQPAAPVAMRWARTPRNEPYAQFLCELTGGIPADGMVEIDPDRVRQRCSPDLALFKLVGP